MIQQASLIPIVTLTPAALAFVAARIKKENGVALRLSVKDSGCNGFAYVTQVVDALNSDDLMCVIEEVTVLIDPSSVKYISGMQIDYAVAENSLGLKKLKFNNPKAAGQCGCGESFNLD